MYGRLNAVSVVRVLLEAAVMFAAVPVVFWFRVGYRLADDGSDIRFAPLIVGAFVMLSTPALS